MFTPSQVLLINARPTGAPSSPIRITFVTDIVTPYMVAVLDELSSRCTLSVIFCSLSGTRGMDWKVEVPFRHVVIDGLTIRRRHLDATDYYFSPRILGAIVRSQPEVVITAGFSFPSLYAALYGLARGVPVIVQSDGTAGSEAGLDARNALARKILRPITWGAVGNSRPAMARFAEIGYQQSRIFLAAHSTNVAPLWEVASRRTTRHEGPLRLLVAGRLIPRKGIALLLEACVVAQGRGADLELTVAGTGPEERALRAQADRTGLRVQWLGFVGQDDMPQVYADADALAFPTLDDPFGFVLLEAAATALPAITSVHAGATADLVEDGVSGLVVEPRDVKSMATAIERLASDPQMRERLGQAARTATEERTPDASAIGYLTAARAALTAAGRPWSA